VRSVAVRCGAVCYGRLGVVRHGWAWEGKVRWGLAGEVWCGAFACAVVRSGRVRHGQVRQVWWVGVTSGVVR